MTDGGDWTADTREHRKSKVRRFPILVIINDETGNFYSQTSILTHIRLYGVFYLLCDLGDLHFWGGLSLSIFILLFNYHLWFRCQ